MKLLAASIFALITGCTAGPGGSAPDAQSGAGSGATPHLQVRLTDAPAAFPSVFVNISRIEMGTASDGWVTLSDEPQQFDLLTLQNDATALLGGADLTPAQPTSGAPLLSGCAVIG